MSWLADDIQINGYKNTKSKDIFYCHNHVIDQAGLLFRNILHSHSSEQVNVWMNIQISFVKYLIYFMDYK